MTGRALKGPTLTKDKSYFEKNPLEPIPTRECFNGYGNWTRDGLYKIGGVDSENPLYSKMAIDSAIFSMHKESFSDEDISIIFARAGEYELSISSKKIIPKELMEKAAKKEVFASKDQRTRMGARKFKRKALGFFGKNTRKTLDQMAKLFVDTGIASSLEEGKNIVPYFVGQRFYLDATDPTMNFGKVENGKGETLYTISIISDGL